MWADSLPSSSHSTLISVAVAGGKVWKTLRGEKIISPPPPLLVAPLVARSLLVVPAVVVALALFAQRVLDYDFGALGAAQVTLHLFTSFVRPQHAGCDLRWGWWGGVQCCNNVVRVMPPSLAGSARRNIRVRLYPVNSHLNPHCIGGRTCGRIRRCCRCHYHRYYFYSFFQSPSCLVDKRIACARAR